MPHCRSQGELATQMEGLIVADLSNFASLLRLQRLTYERTRPNACSLPDTRKEAAIFLLFLFISLLFFFYEVTFGRLLGRFPFPRMFSELKRLIL